MAINEGNEELNEIFLKCKRDIKDFNSYLLYPVKNAEYIISIKTNLHDTLFYVTTDDQIRIVRLYKENNKYGWSNMKYYRNINNLDGFFNSWGTGINIIDKLKIYSALKKYYGDRNASV